MKVANTSKRLKQLMDEREIKQVDILNKVKPLSEKYNIRLEKTTYHNMYLVKWSQAKRNYLY